MKTLNSFSDLQMAFLACFSSLTVQGLFCITPVHTSVSSFAITGSKIISSAASTKVHLQYSQNSKIIQSIKKKKQQQKTKPKTSAKGASSIFNKQHSTWMYL